MIDIWSDWRSRTVELDLDVDQQAARAAGVTSADIATSLQRQLDGQPVSTFRDGDESFPIVMRANEDERTSIDRLRSSAVYAADGSSVPLGQVAELELSGEWGFIQREDMERTVTVEGRHLSMSPDDLAPLLQPKLDEMNAGLAPGHNVKIAGILEESGKNNAALIATLPIVIGITFFLLIAQFGDFRRPLVIFLSLPFATFGAFLGLLVMQAPFGFMAILSLFALFGVIINNSIVLVDRIDIERNAVIAEDVERPKAQQTLGEPRARIRSGDLRLSAALSPGCDDDADDDCGSAPADHRAGCSVLRLCEFGRLWPSGRHFCGLARPYSGSLLPLLRHPQNRPRRRRRGGGEGQVVEAVRQSAIRREAKA